MLSVLFFYILFILSPLSIYDLVEMRKFIWICVSFAVRVCWGSHRISTWNPPKLPIVVICTYFWGVGNEISENHICSVHFYVCTHTQWRPRCQRGTVKGERTLISTNMTILRVVVVVWWAYTLYKSQNYVLLVWWAGRATFKLSAEAWMSRIFLLLCHTNMTNMTTDAGTFFFADTWVIFHAHLGRQKRQQKCCRRPEI